MRVSSFISGAGLCVVLGSAAFAQKPGAPQQDDRLGMECTTEGRVTNCRTVGAGTFSEVWDRAERLRRRPASQSAAVLAELRSEGDALPPPLFMEIAQRLLPEDRQQAAYYHIVSIQRMRYDGARCADTTAGQGAIFFGQMHSNLSELWNDEELRLAAYRRLRDEDSTFDSTHSAWWLCSHGIRASMGGMRGERGGQDFLVSDERLAEIQSTMRGALDTWIEEMSAELE